jgi:KaiC/GvpD/RAD55 family RecA-like ATPase
MSVELPAAVAKPADGMPEASDDGATGALRRVPTGIADFDVQTGGIPTGSIVLLMGEPGAGHQEFALTSAAHLMFRYDQERWRVRRFFLGSLQGEFAYPAKVSYVSITRSQAQVLREVRGSFEASYHEALLSHLIFHDLSREYFADSVVPPQWAASSSLLDSAADSAGRSTNPLAAIAGALEQDGLGNLVIVDSLTDLLVRKSIVTEELVTLIKGMRRRARDWDGLVYLLLARGVTTPATEQALVDSVDGVLSFAWTANPYHSHRQRSMLIEKFMPVLSHVPHEKQGRFVIRVSPLTGLVTTQYERI